MKHYSEAAVERAMKIQEVILRAVAGKLQWWQAAEIVGGQLPDDATLAVDGATHTAGAMAALSESAYYPQENKTLRV